MVLGIAFLKGFVRCYINLIQFVEIRTGVRDIQELHIENNIDATLLQEY